jgi:lysophospholipase L1-like esterase
MLRPRPEFSWRTALTQHVLDKTDGGAFDVHKDDRLVLGLVSATHQGLERGALDVVPVFGGDRWAKPAAPRHACPGMPSAMGAIAGVLSAIIDTPLALRPAAASALLSFEGPVTEPRSKPVPAHWRPKGLGAGQAGGSKAGSFAAKNAGLLLAWGDSWFHLDHPFSVEDWDLARSLADLGWDTKGFAKYSDEGLTLEEMATIHPRTGFYSFIRLMKPLAILIDGGGNDVHRRERDSTSLWYPNSPLHAMTAPPGSTPPLKEEAVSTFVHGQLRGHLDTVLKHLVEATAGSVPIFVHGYDHPIPDGRDFPPGRGWLDPVNDRTRYDLDQGKAIMKLLIDELNTMIAAAVKPFAAEQVRHLELTGTLARQHGFGADYTDWWANELHPTRRGYDALAAVTSAAIEAVLAPAKS